MPPTADHWISAVWTLAAIFAPPLPLGWQHPNVPPALLPPMPQPPEKR